MSKENKNMVSELELEEQNMDSHPSDDLQIVMQGGEPVSVIISMEEFERMTTAIDTAEELLEGKELFLPDGTKATFQEMVTQRVELQRAEYEADLAAMFADESDEDFEEEEESEENQ